MVKISFPTSRKVSCPLLIGAEELKGLDQIIDSYLDRIREDREKIIDEKARRTTDVHFGALKKKDKTPEKKAELLAHYKHDASEEVPEIRRVSLYLTRGREIQAETLSEAMSQPVGETEVPVGFSMSARIGKIDVRVSLSKFLRASLDIAVEPNESETAQELFGALSNWASAIEAPKWQQVWSEHHWLAYVLLFLWLLFGFVVQPLSHSSDAAKDSQRAEAHKLLAQGMNSANEQHALALLLAIESGYDPGARPEPLGVRYWGYVLVIALILILVAIAPEVSIGLWKGRRRLNSWRVWMRVVTIGIPTLLVGSLLLPWILYWLKLTPPTT